MGDRQLSPEEREQFKSAHGFDVDQIPRGRPSLTQDIETPPVQPEEFQFVDDPSGADDLPLEIPTGTPDDTLPSDVRKQTKSELYARLQQAEQQANLVQSLATSVRALREPSPDTKPALPEPYREPVAQQPPEEPSYADIVDPEKGPASIKRLIQLQQAPVTREIAEWLLTTKRDLMMTRDTTREFASAHLAEIDAEVRAMSPQERYRHDSYDRAYAAVQQRHMEEIIEKRVQARIAEAQKAAGAQPAAARVQQESGIDAAPPGGATVRRIRLTPAMKREMDAKGMTKESYARYLRAEGRI